MSHPDEGAFHRGFVVSVPLAEVAHRRSDVQQGQLLLRGELEGRLRRCLGLHTDAKTQKKKRGKQERRQRVKDGNITVVVFREELRREVGVVSLAA